MSPVAGHPGSGDAPATHDAAAARRLLAGGIGLHSLDRLATLAASLLVADSAQVSVLADVEVIAGAHGSAHPRGTTSALSESLCSVTAGCAVPVVLPDARADARVAGLAPVASGSVGAYLGVPMVVASGGIVGALCVYDAEEHAWTARDVAILEQLSEWAVTELELAALGGDFAADRQRWELSVHAAGIGSFDWDLRARRVQSDARMRELFGIDADLLEVPAEVFVQRIHPDDATRVTADVEEAIAGLGLYGTEHRVVHADGEIRWVRTRGRVLGDERGRPSRLLGSTQDTTDEKDADARAVRVLESMSAAFISLDTEWRLTYVNREAEALLSMPREQLLGEDHWELFPLTVGTVFEEHYRRAMATRTPQTFEAYYPASLEAWYEVRALPSPDGLAIYFADVTERHATQELFQLSSEVSERLARSFDVEESIRDLARSLVPRLADWTLVSVAQGHGPPRDVASWHADPALRETVERYAATRLVGREDETTAGEAVRTASTQVIPAGAMEIARAVVRHPEAIAAIELLAPESVVVVPMSTGGRQRGALTMLRSASRPPMTEQEIGVATTIAQRAGLALANAQLFTEQRDTAARLSEANRRLRDVAQHQQTVAQALQEAMLTHLPQPDHLQMTARYLTASAEEKVGGDWYDAVELPGGATVVSIGDVVGHDIHAAAVMGQLRNMLRMVAWDRDEPPSGIVERLDRAMGDLGLDTLATLLVARIEESPADARDGLRTLRWTSAGHPGPVLLESDGTARLLEQEADVLLGVAAERPRHDTTHVVDPDATLLLYTDGLIETHRRDVQAGQQELLRSLEAHHGLGLEALVDAVIGDLVGGEPADDVAVLAVRFGAEGRP